MVEDLIKRLLESGVHFGHQTKRWNPKMKRFIFGQRSGIYIIDLEKTVECLMAAQDFVKEITSKGGKILFIGTKKQAQMIVAEEAKKAEMFFVNNRWLGGFLTNFQTIKKSINRLNEIEQMNENGIADSLTKKELARLMKEKGKLLRDLGGIRNMIDLPDAVFIVDPKREDIAVKEATKLGIPIIGLIDTNCDPDAINFPIPGNDDALKSVRLITSLITESVDEGKKIYLENEKIVTRSKEKAEKEKDEKSAVKEDKSNSQKDNSSEPKKEEVKATSAE
jgi:small subunit ribosomal protein S2